MPRKRSTDSADVSINLTPMIDCVFQLIIFFILAGQVASQAIARLDLYRPLRSQALTWNEQDPNRIIINVPSMAAPDDKSDANPQSRHAAGYVINGKTFEAGDTRTLVEILQEASAPFKASSTDFFVEIRVDRRVNYGDVVPVMRAAAEADLTKLNITALMDAGE